MGGGGIPAGGLGATSLGEGSGPAVVGRRCVWEGTGGVCGCPGGQPGGIWPGRGGGRPWSASGGWVGGGWVG